jgi:amidase
MRSRFCGPMRAGAVWRLGILLAGLCGMISFLSIPAAASPPGGGRPSQFHLLDATIDEVQDAIRSGQLSCTELVKLYLARIKAYNGACVSPGTYAGQLGVVSLIPDAGQVNALMTINLRPAHRIAFGFDSHHSRSQTDLVDNNPNMPDALEVAAAEDASFQKTHKMGPLFCVPMGIKDEYDTFDMRTTSAAAAPYANDRPPEDSVFVQRLRNAGAIILAKN